MKKVLIIAYHFPPRPGISSQRPYGLAKYFPEFGWEPIVLTAKLPSKPLKGIKVIETDYKDVLHSFKSFFGFEPEKGLHQQLGIPVSKNYNYPTLKSRIIKFAKEVITFPDVYKGWYKFALNSAFELLDKEKIDAIISTSAPVAAHVIARKLKRKYKIPWIADFRDLWTQNPYDNKFNIIRYFERFVELKTLADTDALVTVSEPLANTLRFLHNNKKVFTITNGYDPDDFKIAISNLSGKFTITYTGTLYNGKRDPSLLFEAIKQLADENIMDRNLLEIRFFGQKEDWLIDEVKKYNLESSVNLCGVIPRKEALKKQKESQLLLLLLWNDKNEEGVYTGKIFEYLGARRPVFAVGGNGGVVRELLDKTNSGICTNSLIDAKKYLSEYYQEFLTHGEVKYRGNKTTEEYSYQKIAEKYANVLKKIIS